MKNLLVFIAMLAFCLLMNVLVVMAIDAYEFEQTGACLDCLLLGGWFDGR